MLGLCSPRSSEDAARSPWAGSLTSYAVMPFHLWEQWMREAMGKRSRITPVDKKICGTLQKRFNFPCSRHTLRATTVEAQRRGRDGN